MTEGLFSAADLGTNTGAGYRLSHLEVYNWGTFDRQVWRVSPGTETTLLTGDIGSGKSTLVDALTTLLMPSNRVAYNKAAGADAKERTLRSYVEGHYKSERNESTGRSRAKGLRENKSTYSVILGVFANHAHDESVTLAQVFQQRDTTGQPYRFFVTAPTELSIAGDFANFGGELRDLRKRLRDSGADIFDEFPKYGTSFRRLLGIRSEQALELFHQTVSMKSVGNLNEFVRDHMLEPSDASGRVRDIIGHFEDLSKAHDAVKRAREQLELLDPLAAAAEKYDAALAERARLEQERDAVPLFIAELRSGMLAEKITGLEAEGARMHEEQDAARLVARQLADERDALITERANAGGDRIGEVERLGREAQERAIARRAHRVRFDAAVADAGLKPIAKPKQFRALAGLVATERPRLNDRKRTLDASLATEYGRQQQLKGNIDTLQTELTSLEQRTSNLPVEQVELRAQLCAELALTPEALPYAGELLDVLEDQTTWRGAAERVLRGFALSLLVPHEHYDAVTAWTNGRRLTVSGRGGQTVGAKLVFLRVPRKRVKLQPQQHDGLLLSDCLEIREGNFAEYLAAELHQRADHRCTSDLKEFRKLPRAVTPEGQVRSGERHEKDDRNRVDDPRRWVLGWANERKIAALRGELEALEIQLADATSTIDTLSAERNSLQARAEALGKLEFFDSWDDLDFAAAETLAQEYEAERLRLLAGSSRLQEIDASLVRNGEASAEIAAQIDGLTGKLATTAAELHRAVASRRQDDDLVAAQSDSELAAARAGYDGLRARLGKDLPARAEDCADREKSLTGQLTTRIERLGRELGGFGQSLTQYMTQVLTRWPELRADFDAQVDSRADFTALRNRVATDDLPRFESEFREQLHKNAIQELAGFNNWLKRQAAVIDERVAKINDALNTVPYNPGRYIRLEKVATVNQDVRLFQASLRALTDDALAVGDQYSEQRFLEVKAVIERFRGREGHADGDKIWTRRVTDVRNWFTFAASERDLDTDQEFEHYSDSDGKSGGQKEKLAYTILAASLAYQFGLDWGVETSKDFRFAVIDEAFGRGSDASTRYALALFAKLGLQLLIVTPLQKVHVIEPFVQAIGFVDNPTGTSSRVQTMTIEEYRERRQGRR